MEAVGIRTRTLVFCIGGILAVEAVLRAGAGLVIRDPMICLGAARLVEAGLILTVVWGLEKDLASIGLSLKGLAPGIRRGCLWSAGFGLMVLIGAGLACAIGYKPLSLLHTDLPREPIHLLVYVAVGGLIAPVTEEIFFRGILYCFFRKWGVLTAIALSTLAFVIVHPVFSAIPVTQTVGGLLFAVSYEIEKNLWVPITIHSSGNLAIFSLSLIT